MYPSFDTMKPVPLASCASSRCGCCSKLRKKSSMPGRCPARAGVGPHALGLDGHDGRRDVIGDRLERAPRFGE